MSARGKDRASRGAGTPAMVALQAADVEFSMHHFDPHAGAGQSGDEGYGMQAARELGLDPSAVFKTLLAEVDGAPTVAVVPVDGTLDLKSLASACSARRAAMMEPAVAQRITGYVVGGISPLGQRRSLPTVVDQSVLGHEQVFVSGGRRGLDLGLAPADLIRLTSAKVAPIARRSKPS